MAVIATEPLFVEDAYAKSCPAKVVNVSETGAIQLDRTVFYAAGGGQPGDVGDLRWDGGGCRIGATVKGEAPARSCTSPLRVRRRRRRAPKLRPC